MEFALPSFTLQNKHNKIYESVCETKLSFGEIYDWAVTIVFYREYEIFLFKTGFHSKQAPFSHVLISKIHP